MDIARAAASGDQLQLLYAMRSEIANAIHEGVPPRDLASLTRRLQDISKEIASIEERQKQESDNGNTSFANRRAEEDDEWTPEAI